MKKLYLVFALFLGVSASAATISISCNYNAITNALLSTAQEGDTVLIGAGDCYISNAIWIDRNISFTIAGSGSNSTTLRAVSGQAQTLWIQSSSSNVFTVRDLDLVGGPNDSGAFLMLGRLGKSFPGMFHVYNIQMTNILIRGISGGYGGARGLIDHCYLVSAGTGNQLLDFEGNEYGSWTNANPIGTTNVVCVEDCYLWNKAGGGNGFFDAYEGAQFVLRHCVWDGASAAGVHGYDSSAIAPRTWEIYNNLITNLPINQTWVTFRGGTGVLFSNVISGAGGNLSPISYYRACPLNHPYPTDTGYLLVGQAGHSYTVNFDGTTLDPGISQTYPGNPTNTQVILLGFTSYTFITNLNDASLSMANKNGYGGGAVKIGATTAETITNFYKAVNIVADGYGVSYSNWNGSAYLPGHEFIAVGLDTANLILTNALDSNSNSFGWPANQQTGVVTSYPLTGTNFVNAQALWPAYAWSNVVNGAVQGFSVPGDLCSDFTTNLLKLNRDYFNSAPAPATYTPLVYPHPLSGGGGVITNYLSHIGNAQLGNVRF